MAAGSTVNVTSANFTNFSGTTLTGGIYTVAGTFEFVGANIAANAAAITLNGPAAIIKNNQNGNNALANLASNTVSLALEAGQVLSTAAGVGLTNTGSLAIDATTGTPTTKLNIGGNYSQSAGATTLVAGGILAVAANDTASVSGGTLQGTGVVSGNLAASGSGTVSPGTNGSASIITVTGNLTMNAGSALTEKLLGPNSTTPVGGTDFDQLVVGGSVTLNNPTLNASRNTSYVPGVGASFEFIAHTGPGAIIGNFNNLAEGKSDTIGNILFGVTYKGGDSNDAVLTTLPPPTVFVDLNWAGTPVGSEPSTDPVGNLVFTYNAFSDIPSAINQAAAAGTVVIYGGTYTNAVDIDKPLAEIDAAVNPLDTPSVSTVTFGQAVTLAGGITTFVETGANAGENATAANLTFASTIDDVTAGTDSLAVNGSQTVTFDAPVGGTTPLAAITDVDTTTDLNASLISAATQSYSGAVAIGAGLGTVDLTASQGIVLSAGARFTTTNTSLTLSANAAGTASGTFAGIVVNGAVILSSGTGAISLQGQGSNAAGTANSGPGIVVEAGGSVQATGSGAITLTGSGGAKSDGIDIAGNGTNVSATGGDILLQGTLGSQGLDAINVQGNGALLMVGSGNLTLQGDIIDLAANVSVASTGAGQLLFEPLTPTRPIVLGGSDTAGNLAYTDSDNAAIGSSFSRVAIGSAADSGSISTAKNVTFVSNVIVQTAGPITVGNTLAENASALLLSGGTITVNGVIDTPAGNSGNLTLTAAGNITLNAGAAIKTGNGNINLSADAAGTTVGTFVGITVNDAAIQSTGTGNISLQGQGNNAAATANGGAGILLTGGAAIDTTGGGSVALQGIGVSKSDGIDITGNGTTVNAAGARARPHGGARGGNGVVLAATASTTNGNLSITGTGQTNDGVDGSGTISTANGALSITGTTDGAGRGIDLFEGVVQATGTGSIALQGALGSQGIDALFVESSGAVTVASGNVILTGDVIDLVANAGKPTVTSTGAGQLLFQPLTVGRSLFLGGSDTPGSLVFTDADGSAVAQGGANGFSLITIGNATGGGNVATADNVSFGAGAIVQTTGSITLSNTLNETGMLELISGSTVAQTTTGGVIASSAPTTVTITAPAGIGTASRPLVLDLAAGSSLDADSSGASANQSLATVTPLAIAQLNAGSGVVTLADGTFLFAGQNALGAGALDVSSGGTLTYTGGTAPSLSNILSLAGGAGVASWAAGLTLPASTVLPTAGSLLFNDDSHATSAITVQAPDTLAGNLTIQVGGGNANVGAVDWTGVIGGSGGLVKPQVGLLTLAGANGYAGGTTINGGILQIDAADNLGDPSGGLAIGAGVLEASGTFASTRAITVSDPVSAIQVDADQTLTLGRGIAGSGSLTLAGPGSVVLNGASSYPGATTVNAGTLGGDGSIASDLILNSGTVSPGVSSSPLGVFTVNGNFTQNGGTLSFNIGGTTPGASLAQLAVAGAVTLGADAALAVQTVNGFQPTLGDNYPVMTFSSSTGDFANANGLTLNDLFLIEQINPANRTLVASSTISTLATISVNPTGPTTYGTAATLSATVTNTSGSSHFPTGSVEFFDGAIDLGPGTLQSQNGVVSTFALTTKSLNAGSRSLQADFFGTNGFADIDSTPLPFTVNQAPLMVSADNKTIDLGTALPTLTDTITGFVNGDTADGNPALSTTFNAGSPAGIYAISVSAGTLTEPNYNVQFSNGTLTVNGPPGIITGPTNPAAPILVGGTASFTATASDGFPTPTTVQWKINTGGGFTQLNNGTLLGATFSGATTDTLTVTNGTAALNNAQFEAVFSNAANLSVTTTAAALTVDFAPTIAANGQPTNQAVSPGGTATFTAIAIDGNPVPTTVQWQVSTDNGHTFNPITGATSTTLSLVAQSAQTNDLFEAVFSNAAGLSVTTNAAKLTVVAPIAPKVILTTTQVKITFGVAAGQQPTGQHRHGQRDGEWKSDECPRHVQL